MNLNKPLQVTTRVKQIYYYAPEPLLLPPLLVFLRCVVFVRSLTLLSGSWNIFYISIYVGRSG